MAIAAVAGLASAIGASAAGFAFFSFAAGGFAAFAGYFALGAGLSMVSRALAPRPNMGAQMRGITQTTREPAGSRKIIYGKMRVGGNVVFIAHSGDDNKYLHLAVVFATHHINSYEEVWFNDNKIWTASGGFQSDWGTYVTMDTTKLGTSGQSASSLLTPIAEWTADHKLSGIAYIAFKLEWNQDKFPQGVPNITAVVKGKRVFDPRTSVTAYSTNPALCLRDYMLDQSYGLGESNLNIDSTALNAAADLCDEQVSLDAGGTQDRYQCNGVIDTANQIKANIEQLLASMGGKLTYSGGKYFVDGAEYKTPTHTFTEADVISEIQTQTKQSRRGIYNGVKGIFVSEEKNYKVLDYPAQISSSYATEDGDPLYLDMPLPFVTNNLQAQRLAKIALLKSRQQVVITMTVNLKGLQVKVGDTIQITNDRLNYSSKVFEVIDYSLAIGDGQALAVNLVCIETASAIYDWTTSDEEDFLSGGELDLYDGRTVDNVTSLTLTEIGLRGPDGGVSSSVQLAWTAPTDAFIEFYKIRYNKNGTTDYFEVQSREPNVLISGLDVTSNYDFRVQAENLLGVTSTGTTLSNQALNGDTTAPSAPTGGAATGGIQTITAEWDNPSDIDFKHVEVYVNTSDSIPASPTALVDGEEYVVTGLSGAVTRYFWLKSVDFSGNKSAATASFNATSVVATTTDIGAGAVTTTEIGDDAVTVTKLANVLQSTNYVAGTTGWEITTAGNVEFSNGTFRGTVTVGSTNLTESNTINSNTTASDVGLGNVENRDAQDQAETGLEAGTTITSGGITLSSGGVIKGGQTAFNTGTGFFLGYESAAYKFSIGSSGNYLTWDGSTLTVKGSLVVGNTTLSESNTLNSNQSASDITTGTLDASTITVTNLSADSITAGTLNANRINIDGVTLDVDGSGQLIIANDGVGSAQIANGAVGLTEFASGIQPVQVVSTLPASASEGDMAYLTTDNKLYRYDGSAWIKAVDGADVSTGTLPAASIVANSITAGQIAAGAINTDELAANSVNADKIQVNSITANKISGDISEVFNLGVFIYPQHTVTSSKTTACEFTVPAPDSAIKKYASLVGRFKYAPSADLNDCVLRLQFERKSTGTSSGTSIGTVQGSGSIAPYFHYVEVSGNKSTVIDTFGGLANAQTSPSTIVTPAAVEYQSTTDRTRIIYGNASSGTPSFTSGTIYYNEDRWLSTGTWLVDASGQQFYPIPAIGLATSYTMPINQALANSSTEENYRLRVDHLNVSTGTLKLTALQTQVILNT
jgi:hypothetical protein